MLSCNIGNYLVKRQSERCIIIIIHSLKVGTSKNKNIDNRGKESCAYESEYISYFVIQRCQIH